MSMTQRTQRICPLIRANAAFRVSVAVDRDYRSTVPVRFAGHMKMRGRYFTELNR